VHASEREVAAAEAERASVKLKQVEYFSNKIGEVRKGVISGVSEWGLYVSDDETATEGMVRLSSLTDDTYEHQPKKFAAVGLRTKRIIRMGDPVTYKIEAANLDDRTLDFSLIEKT
jgi:ribonuclease R